MTVAGRGSSDAGIISAKLVDVVRKRILANQQIRRNLPEWGRVAIDRQLPFLCVYRRPTRVADPGTDRLATSEPSYVICSAKKSLHDGLRALVGTVAEQMVERFGAFVVLEIWAGPPLEISGTVTTSDLTPRFQVRTPKGSSGDSMADVFEDALSRIKVGRRRARVVTEVSTRRWPKGMQPILDPQIAAGMGCSLYGLEVAPIYRDPESGEVFPFVLRELRRRLSVALRRVFFDFVRSQTTAQPVHFHALGRRAMVKAVWDADRMLADSAESFDFLLQVTPVNGDQAWREFKRFRFERQPVFHYRPLPSEPVVLKRELYRAPVERVEDPSLAMVFRQKLNEIDRQITMLQDRNTSRFVHESIQLFGGVDDDLYEVAKAMLEKIPPRSREGSLKGTVSAQVFAEKARQEIEYFRGQYPGISATVEVREDVTGLLVNRGNLLVSAKSQIPSSRVEALIQHEVGTHVLTYFNGRAQRLRHLYVGFAGYDALQEGLAVLSEYLVGGLNKPRLRLLAGRVVAIRRLIEGAAFVDTFRELDRAYDFSHSTAFTIALRTYRGGGLTKDAIYLRGLMQILNYLGTGGDIENLFVGKIAADHIPIVRELRWRGILKASPLTPRYMKDPDALKRLERLREGVSVHQLLDGRKK